MKLIRTGRYRSFGEFDFHWSIEEKKFFGWKTILTYSDTDEGRNMCIKTIKQMQAQGYILVN